MIDFTKIWANARYEITILLRGWFFRIFAGISILIFIAIDIILFSNALPVPKMFKGFSASIPYATMMMFNIAQIAIIIFMAGDFFKRDKNLNTSQVYYIRSMTNNAYLIGKAAGILLLFLMLNLLILGIAGIVHAFFTETPLTIVTYFIYPLILGLPSLIFMIGLSFLLMRVIGNQPVVALLLLGYYALTLIYLADQNDFIFDFAASRLPLAYSDFIGFANLHQVLLQRGFYLFLGLTLILLSMIFFKRLPQSTGTRWISILAACIFAISSVYCILIYTNINSEHRQLRAEIREIDKRYQDLPNLQPQSYKIDLVHTGSNIAVTSEIKFTNPNNNALNRFFFTLNPDLHVSQLSIIDHTVTFKREGHVIDIEVDPPIQAGAADSVKIEYSGSINDAICFTDIDEEIRNGLFTIWLFQLAKKHAFLSKNYVLLNSESLWYPMAGLSPGVGYPEKMDRFFKNYYLSVSTGRDLIAISQGTTSNPQPGVFQFTPDAPLENISLAIGPYQSTIIRVDSIDFQLYALPGHDYYQKYFTDIGDTLANVLHELKEEYEVRLGMDYPFKRLSLIEVPIQYYCYPRLWTVTQAISQPEQIWFQENAAAIESADFRTTRDRMDHRLGHSNQTLSEVETQINMLKTFLNQVFLGKSERRFRFGDRMMDYDPDYNIFPNFYSHVSYLNAEKRQIFNTALEAYLVERVMPVRDNGPVWIQEGLTEDEEVSQALRSASLADLFEAQEKNIHLPLIVKQKGANFFKLMRYQFKTTGFDARVSEIVSRYRFRNLNFSDFINQLALGPDFDIDAEMEKWYNSRQLPAYYITNPVLYKVFDGNRIRSQILFSINNPEPVDGLIEVSFQYAGRGRGMPFGMTGDEEPPRLFRIASGQILEIGALLDEEPRTININFLIAQNIPLVYTKRFEDAELNKTAIPFDGTRLPAYFSGQFVPGEIVVDNENKMFEIFNLPFSSSLKRLIHGEIKTDGQQTYDRFQWWHPPSKWTLIKNPAFYGDYIHSAYYIGSGNGDRYVTWKAEISTSGLYDIYVYLFSKDGFWRGRDDRRNVTYGDYKFIVTHDGGDEKIDLDTEKAPEGWNFIGTWYFSAGEARIRLTDESNGTIIVADAVKWVKN